MQAACARSRALHVRPCIINCADRLAVWQQHPVFTLCPCAAQLVKAAPICAGFFSSGSRLYSSARSAAVVYAPTVKRYGYQHHYQHLPTPLSASASTGYHHCKRFLPSSAFQPLSTSRLAAVGIPRAMSSSDPTARHVSAPSASHAQARYLHAHQHAPAHPADIASGTARGVGAKGRAAAAGAGQGAGLVREGEGPMEVDESLGPTAGGGEGAGGGGVRGPGEEARLEAVLRYHEQSKHHLRRYARGPGRLDWASQPDPFRRYEGAPLLHLPRHSFEPDGSAPEPQHHTLSHTPHTHTSSFPSWDEISLGITPQLSQPQLPSQPTQLSSQQASQPTHGPQPISLAAVSQLLYYSLALSGWKAAGGEAWSLRVDPSSGNLHPTEAHLILPPMGSHVAGGGPFVAHYAPREHALEVRGRVPADSYARLTAPWVAHSQPGGTTSRETAAGAAAAAAGAGAAAGLGAEGAAGGAMDMDAGGRGVVAGTVPAGGVVLVCLSSVLWREAWKYGERAFRYCSLDNGHALAALTTSARLLGWHAQLVDSPTAHELSTLFNLPQPPQLTSMNAAAAAPVPTPTTTTHPEPEHPDCLVALWPAAVAAGSSADVIQHAGTTAAHSSTGTVSSLLMYDLDPAAVAEAVARTEWAPATANVLSRYHYGSWAAVDQVAAATARYSRPSSQAIQVHAGQEGAQPSAIAAGAAEAVLAAASRSGKTAHAVIRGRRSAVDFDARAEMPRAVLLRLLWALTPRDADGAMHHPCLSPGVVGGMGSGGGPGVSVLLFVHRVEGVEPGLYCLIRNPTHLEALRPRTRPYPSHAWGRPGWCPEAVPLYRLASGDCMEVAQATSCDQDIACDCCVAMAMVGELSGALSEHGPPAYARLHWECGAIGQAVYLEAEGAGLQATGIGCFADDPSVSLLNVAHGDFSFQTLYHIAVGAGVTDSRVTSLPAYHHLT